MSIPDFDESFEAELRRRDLSFARLEPDLYELRLDGEPLTVSTENLRRDYLRDGDASALGRFVARLLHAHDPLPPWPAMREALFPNLDCADMQRSEDTLLRALSEDAVAVLTWYDEEAGLLRALRACDLRELGVEEAEAWRTAESNLERILSGCTISYIEAAGAPLGIIEAHAPHKASLLLCRGIKDKVEPVLGWPVYAVAPARDFVYLFSHEGGLIDRVGHVVVREFLGSGYPISTDVWELSDTGVEAIGSYPTAPAD